jgi:hypothetical protein
MAVSIPLVAIFGAIVYVAWRYMGLRIWHGIACIIFGFLLAATNIAPQISNLINGIVQWLTKP